LKACSVSLLKAAFEEEATRFRNWHQGSRMNGEFDPSHLSHHIAQVRNYALIDLFA
jgi:hypothetical protein